MELVPIETQHAEMVQALAKSGEQIKQELTARECALIHALMGITGEAGELMDAIKKAAIYRKGLDITNIIEELGDLEWYMELLRSVIGVTREQCLAANMVKLAERYKNFRYSNEAAIARADKAGEAADQKITEQ